MIHLHRAEAQLNAMKQLLENISSDFKKMDISVSLESTVKDVVSLNPGQLSGQALVEYLENQYIDMYDIFESYSKDVDTLKNQCSNIKKMANKLGFAQKSRKAQLNNAYNTIDQKIKSFNNRKKAANDYLVCTKALFKNLSESNKNTTLDTKLSERIYLRGESGIKSKMTDVDSSNISNFGNQKRIDLFQDTFAKREEYDQKLIQKIGKMGGVVLKQSVSSSSEALKTDIDNHSSGSDSQKKLKETPNSRKLRRPKTASTRVSTQVSSQNGSAKKIQNYIK